MLSLATKILCFLVFVVENGLNESMASGYDSSLRGVLSNGNHDTVMLDLLSLRGGGNVNSKIDSSEKKARRKQGSKYERVLMKLNRVVEGFASWDNTIT
jgi:hypothetical protein